MNKQEAIEKIKRRTEYFKVEKEYNRGFRDGLNNSIPVIREIDAPERPVVPQFVADFYEENKDDLEYNLYKLCIDFREQKLRADLHGWFNDDNHKCIETLVKMKLYGYEVEKEKLYTVELPDPNGGGHVILCKNGDGTVSIAFSSVARWRGSKNVQLTESEIKKDFEWAWQFAKEVEE